MARLVINTTEGQVLEFELSAARHSVGRTEDNDICIPDGSVSSSHGEFTHDGHTWTFTDLGSTNGTKVNGERVQNVELGHGASFDIGNTAATFYDEAAAPAAPAARSGGSMFAAPRSSNSSSSAGDYGSRPIERGARTGFGKKKPVKDGSRSLLMTLGVLGLLAVLGMAGLILTGGLGN
jgi:pSer/pThr/pTyr-binding forkhead associated (FHA) protein